MLLKLRLIFIWWQELLSAGLDVVAGLKEFLSDVQSAGVKPLWETARGRQNSAQSRRGGRQTSWLLVLSLRTGEE